MTRQEFIDLLMPHALEASRRTGVDPRIIIAQAAQETGWGRAAPGNNFFGIKSHGQGGGNTFSTTEYVNGQPVRINDSFRSYESPAASVAGYADFLLANPRYRAMMAAQGIEAQLQALGASGYATDPNYASSVGSIARSITVPGGAQPMAYTAPAATPAAQGAINAATGPAAGLPAPAPAPGSQRLFRPRSEAIAAREAGGTPRLDELSNIIQQRRAGMNPLLDRLQNFIQTRRAARQDDQAPTPPAPIPNAGGGNRAPSSGGGGSNADPAVMQLQQELAAAGFDPGPIDGLMGPRTRAAMQARDAAGPAMPAAPAGGGLPRPSIMDRTMAAVKGGVGQMQVDGPATDKMPAPLPRANIARPGVAAPVMGDGMVNRSYTQPTGQMAPRPVTGDGMVDRQFTMPTGQMPAAPAANPQFAQMLALEEALARQQAGEPQRIAEQDARWRERDAAVAAAPPAAPARMNWGLPIQPQNPASVPTPSANPTLGPMLAGYQMPPPQAASPGGVLPRATDPTLRVPASLSEMTPGFSPPGRMPTYQFPQPAAPPQVAGPGAGGRPVSTNPTTLVGNTGTPFTRQDSVNRGFMPAGRDDFGAQSGFFRDLPSYVEQNPYLTSPQGDGLRRPVTSTTPPMPQMPLRATWPVPPWWRQFMGAGV